MAKMNWDKVRTENKFRGKSSLPRNQRKATAKKPKKKTYSKIFESKYNSWCNGCKDPISIGQRVKMHIDLSQVFHEKCFLESKKRATRTQCHTSVPEGYASKCTTCNRGYIASWKEKKDV